MPSNLRDQMLAVIADVNAQVAEREELEEKRRAERPAAMWPSFLWLTVFRQQESLL